MQRASGILIALPLRYGQEDKVSVVVNIQFLMPTVQKTRQTTLGPRMLRAVLFSIGNRFIGPRS